MRYKHYENITRELLDSIGVGDQIKVNGWSKPLTVVGVSENFFVMESKKEYSVCDKRPSTFTYNEGRRNEIIKGKFRVARDCWLSGWYHNGECGRKFGDPNWVKEYLASFELDESNADRSELSQRGTETIRKIAIAKSDRAERAADAGAG